MMRSSSFTFLLVQLFLVADVLSWMTPLPKSSFKSTSALCMGKEKKSDAMQSKQDVMLNFIDNPQEDSDAVGYPPEGPPEEDEEADFVRCIVKAADGRKAEDMVAIRVSKVSTMTSFIVICSGNSRPQNQAITAAIVSDVEEKFGRRTEGSGVPEGNADSGWIVLDYGQVMVHVMTPKSRLFYDVEGQWREKGEYMNLSDVLVPNTIVEAVNEEDAQMGGAMADLAEEDDPFWS